MGGLPPKGNQYTQGEKVKVEKQKKYRNKESH